MCINPTKGRFMVERSDVLSSQIICTSRADILFCFSFSFVNDILACSPFKKFWKASKYSGEVKKTKISCHW